MNLTPSDYIQILAACIYGAALFYTIVTFRRTKRLDQITLSNTIFGELRQLDRELAKMPSGVEYDSARIEVYIRILNTLDYLSFLVNEKVISDKSMITYMKSDLIGYYGETLIQKILKDERNSHSYQQFKKLYQKIKMD
jgi:hypothetical protein